MTLREIRGHVRAMMQRADKDRNALTKNDTFTDQQLNDMINQASRMFLRDTRLLQTSSSVTITNGVGPLTDAIITVDRVEINNEPIGFISVTTFPEDLPITTY